MAYATLAQFRDYIDTVEVRHDALLTSLIARATAMIENHVGFTFEAGADTTRYLDAHSVRRGGHVDGRDLIFPTWCASITSIVNGDDTTVAAASYATLPRIAPYYGVRLKRSKSIVWESDAAADTEGVIEVTGRWGYSTSAPADIVHATIRLVTWMYHQRTNQTEVDRPLLAEGVLILPSQLPKDVVDILETYRWRGV